MNRKVLIRLRIDKKLTVREMAKLMEMDSSSYWRRENGETKFSEVDIVKLKKIFNVSTEIFFE
ncbi:helix-turn-helix transcriptional regulator [Exiguobacterium sp. s127]|uniref:helix-turn-helix domain-containing protein n=1 Tax=Exiguobacterium sp. s127 TaxID=2751210 RepID=UPI001BEAAC81|nr:helix-turn-helix transcriptional regulator [Exiguobacterium sp. s127]